MGPTLAVGTALVIATMRALVSLRLPLTLPSSEARALKWSGLEPTALAEPALVVSLGPSLPLASAAAVATLFQAPTLILCAATRTSKNAATKVFAIARPAFALVSLVTLVPPANVLPALMTALDTALADPTGTLHTTGQLPKPPRFRMIKLTTRNCSRRLILPRTMTLGTLTCTMVACATKVTVVPVPLWWSAPRLTILLMISVALAFSSQTTSCNTMLLSVVQAGKQLTRKEVAVTRSKATWPKPTTTPNTFLTTMAARYTVAMVPCLAKTALAVVSVITLVAHASASAVTLALLVRRSRRWLRLFPHHFIC